MKVSSFLFEFHKLCEGVHSEAYLDPVGILTIGVGHANQDTATFNKHSKWSDEKIREVWELDVAEAERLANQYLEGYCTWYLNTIDRGHHCAIFFAD